MNKLVSYHVWYQNKSQNDQTEWLTSACSQWWDLSLDGASMLCPRIEGTKVCVNCICQMYGFSKSKLESCMKRDPSTVVMHGNIGNKNAAKPKVQDAMFSWLTDFFDALGDRMPDNETIHMPAFLSILQLHDTYSEDMKQKGVADSRIASVKTFSNFIAEHFANIRFPRRTRLGRCDFCTSIQGRRLKCHSEAESAALKAEIAAHLAMVMTERMGYHLRRHQAETFPKSFASIILDAPTKPVLPNLSPIPKSLARAKVLELFTMGSIMHNTGVQTLQYYLSDFGKSADACIFALYWKVWKYLKSVPLGEQASVLYVQLDNEPDNKNRWMFGFLALLVH